MRMLSENNNQSNHLQFKSTIKNFFLKKELLLVELSTFRRTFLFCIL